MLAKPACSQWHAATPLRLTVCGVPDTAPASALSAVAFVAEYDMPVWPSTGCGSATNSAHRLSLVHAYARSRSQRHGTIGPIRHTPRH